MSNLELIDWLKKRRREQCPICKPTTFPYSLIKATYWCPTCEKIWRYRYYNPENSIKKALRVWYYENDPKSVVKIYS